MSKKCQVLWYSIILTNRAYIGDMVQGKVKQELCHNIAKQYADKTEWIIVENTHEPIIGRELFFGIQELLEEKSREQAEKKAKSGIRGHKEENLLKGYLRCGYCGKSFNLSQTMRRGKVTRQYYCSGYRVWGSPFCTNKGRVHKDILEQAVLRAIQGCILQLTDEKWLKDKKMEEQPETDEKRIIQIDRKIQHISVKIADLYKDTAEGILDDADYLLLKTDFSKRKEILEKERTQLILAVSKAKKKQQNISAVEYLKRYQKSKVLTREMIECFVSGVKIYGKDRIEVELLCRDKIMEGLEG